MTAKVTSSHQRGNLEIQFVRHDTPATHDSPAYSEYTIQIHDREKDTWTRHGGRGNYYRNYEDARRDFYNVCSDLLDPPARAAFETIA